jgi:hypothetical protein
MELRLKVADDIQARVILSPIWEAVYDDPAPTYAQFLDTHELLLSLALARVFAGATDFRSSGWLCSRPF